MSGIVGAVYQYLHTGQGPQELKDYFFPKREDGSRITLPTDVKDIYHYSVDPVQTVVNKASPLVNTTVEMLRNRDFYERPIRNADDPLMKQAQQELEFIGRQTLPFTLQPHTGKKVAPDANPEHRAENFLGFTRAPASMQPGYKPRKVRGAGRQGVDGTWFQRSAAVLLRVPLKCQATRLCGYPSPF